MSKAYIQNLANVGEEVEGKTYFKDPGIHLTLPEIELGTITGSNVTVKIGTDTSFSTITTAEALAYINFGGGFSDTV